MNQVDLRRKNGEGGPGGDYRDVFDTPGLSNLQFDGQGKAVAVSQFECRENFDLLTATSVAAGSAKLFVHSGTGTEVIARATKGGENLKSQATTPADGDNVILGAVSTTNVICPISSTSKMRFATRVAINTITAMFASVGLNENITDVDPTGTAGDGAMFAFDPTGEFASSVTGYATNWLLCHKVDGTDTFTNTGIPVVAGKDYDLVIQLDADLKANFYIDGEFIAQGPALTSGDSLSCFAGLELTATPGEQKDMDVRYISLARFVG